MLIKNADLRGRIVDLRLSDRVVEIGPGLDADAGDDAIDAAGCAVLPGLHDHHIHLRAAAVAMASVDCSAVAADDPLALAALMAAAPAGDWIRCVGYHESMAGDLDRAGLDRLCAYRPVRLQHSSGKLWVLNSLAIERLGLERETHRPGLERDGRGRITGRLWRMDAWLRARLPRAPEPSLHTLSRRLAGFGITGVTDASYTNDAEAAAALRLAQREGELLQHVEIMGDESLAAGWLKIMLDEDGLPDLGGLGARMRRAREQGRSVAFHCVSHVELLVALSALAEVGARPGDRIEHAGVVRREVLAQLAASGVTVVTQPGFVAQRGERFRRAVEPDDEHCLYPYASLLAAGVPVAASSDAPYGPVNPWRIMAAAVTRETEAGTVLTAAEAVAPDEALRGYLSPPDQPGAAARSVAPGSPADLCVLNCSFADALGHLGEVEVSHTLIGGQRVYDSSANTSSLCSPR